MEVAGVRLAALSMVCYIKCLLKITLEKFSDLDFTNSLDTAQTGGKLIKRINSLSRNLI